MNEMKKLVLTETEKAEYRRKWIEELDSNRIGKRPVTSINRVIRLLEDNAYDINDVMQDKDVNGHYSPHLQAVFDDTMDILDYLRSINGL